MFKNPLKKYQQGGQVSQEQAEDQIVSAIALQLSGNDQNMAQSLLGPVKQRFNEIKNDEERSKILKTGLTKLQNQDESGMQDILSLFSDLVQSKKFGGKLHAFITKHVRGGNIVKGEDGIPGLSRAAVYYRRHANEDSIRKIQTFLAGRGYNVGDLDGKFGKNTFESIRQYQRDNGLKDDGMWGEDTNQVHRVLTSENSTFNGPRSGAHPGKHTYDKNFVGFRYSDGDSNQKLSYSDIGNAQARAISDYDWFTGDDESAVKWRSFFRDSKDPRIQAMYNEILDNYTPGQLRAINYKQLPVDRQQENYNAGIAKARNEAAPYVAATLAAPVLLSEMAGAAIASLPTFAGSVAGGLAGTHLGGLAGRQVGEDISRPIYDDKGNRIGWSNINSKMATDRNGRDIPVVVPSYGQTGEAVGKVVGGTAGAMAGGYAANKFATGQWGWQGRPGDPDSWVARGRDATTGRWTVAEQPHNNMSGYRDVGHGGPYASWRSQLRGNETNAGQFGPRIESDGYLRDYLEGTIAGEDGFANGRFFPAVSSSLGFKRGGTLKDKLGAAEVVGSASSPYDRMAHAGMEQIAADQNRTIHDATSRESNITVPSRFLNPLKRRRGGRVVKGQNSIPSGMPEPSTGEIRPDSNTNPIRRWIDRAIDNNSALRTASRYARNFGNSAMGKVLGFFMPDTENMYTAIAPVGKISNLGNLTDNQKLKLLGSRIPSEAPYDQKFISELKAASLEKEAIKEATKAKRFYSKSLPNDLDIDKYHTIDKYNLDFTPNYNSYIQNIDFNNLTKPSVWDRIGSAIEASPWIGIPAVTGAAIYKSEKDKKKKQQEETKNENK